MILQHHFTKEKMMAKGTFKKLLILAMKLEFQKIVMLD